MTLRLSSPSLLLTLLIALFLFTTTTSAARPTSFCKCTCGSNSTIIPLRYEPPPPPPPHLDNETYEEPQTRRTGTCIDCNRSFCLENRVNAMPICEESKDEQIFAKCFQRDSAKDEAVIYTFIFITIGLLIYSAIRPWVSRRIEAAQERRTYSSVSSGQGN